MKYGGRVKVVVDTSVLVAALRSASGAAAAVLILVLELRVRMLLSYSLLCEYKDVAVRPDQLKAFRLSADQVTKLIMELEELAEPLAYNGRHGQMSIDPRDDMVLEAAINGRADCIVTHNIKHLREPASRFRIDVRTPKEFLEWWRREE